jgi:hypothetical protein
MIVSGYEFLRVLVLVIAILSFVIGMIGVIVDRFRRK